MPIVDVEMVTDDAPAHGLAARLADAIGQTLGAAEGATWVRLRVLERGSYGESGGALAADVQPVFVTVTAQRRPTGEQLADAIRGITSAVADATRRPRMNVHVIFEPDGAGRVAFGGRLVS